MNKSALKILFVLIGAMVGAGFASGKEVFLFFSRYGTIGVISSIFSSFLTCFIIYKTLMLIKCYNLDNYNSFICVITNKKKSLINSAFSIIINSFLYFSFVIMVSGFGAFFNQTYNMSALFPIIIVSLLCFYLFNNSVDNMTKINTLLIPFLIFIIFFYSSKKVYIDFSLLNLVPVNFVSVIISSILYSSYNSILLIPVIISLYKFIQKCSIKSIRFISILAFLIFSVLSISVINLLLSLDYNLINSVDLPILLAIENIGSTECFLYGIIIIIAIFTSAISAGYSLAINFKNSKHYSYLSFILCFSTILFYKIDFSSLVSGLYPVFGILGIIQILYLLLKKVPKTDIN